MRSLNPSIQTHQKALIQIFSSHLQSQQTYPSIFEYDHQESASLSIFFQQVYDFLKNMDRFLESMSRLPSESLSVMNQNIVRLKTVVKQLKKEQKDFNLLNIVRNADFAEDITEQLKQKANCFRLKKLQLWASSKMTIAFIVVFLMLSLGALQQINVLATQDIEDFITFLVGTSQLSNLLSKNIKISTLILDSLLSQYKLSSKQALQTLIGEVKKTNRIKIVRMVEPKQKQANSYLFSSWKNVQTVSSDSSIKSIPLDLSLMQSVSKAIKIYEQVYNKMNKDQSIDASFIVRLAEITNRMTHMIKEVLKLTKINLSEPIFPIQFYIWLYIVWMLFNCGFMGGIMLFKLYKSDKIAFEGVLQQTTIEQLLNVPELGVFIHRAKLQQKYLGSG